MAAQAQFGVATTLNTFLAPNHKEFENVYKVYKPSLQTKRLLSETGRRLFAEDFIENIELGTLEDLCIRALAKGFNAREYLPLLGNDPYKQQLYYDSLSIDLPFDQCCHITDESYWKRVVLAKSKNNVLNKTKNWKNMAMSLKLVEILEAYPPEVWQNEPFRLLSLKIKEYITDLNICGLRPMGERMFDKYRNCGSDILLEGIQDYSCTFTPLESSEMELEMDTEYYGEEEDWQDIESNSTEIQGNLYSGGQNESQVWSTGESSVLPLTPTRITRVTRINKSNVLIQSIFDINASATESDDNTSDILDNRNLEKNLQYKKFKYPENICHHIDLRFLRFFDQLETLAIEFNPPDSTHQFQVRNTNVSYLDMDRLAYALNYLHKLKTFRIRRSRMDYVKVQILAKALARLKYLQTVDFGFDQLQDNCAKAISDIFKNTNLKSLELEGNNLGNNTLTQLGKELSQFPGQLEYLGLAHNPVGDEGLHAVCTAIIGTEHIRHLSLTAINVSKAACIESIAKVLVCQHKPLRVLEIVGVPIGAEASRELLKAFAQNTTLLYLDCRGCDMPLQDQEDVEVLHKRNLYILNNPYLMEDSTSTAELALEASQKHNPIYERAMNEVERRKGCIRLQSIIPHQFSDISKSPSSSSTSSESSSCTINSPVTVSSYIRYKQILQKRATSMQSRLLSFRSVISQYTPMATEKPFVYDPNKYNEKEIVSNFYIRRKPKTKVVKEQNNHKLYDTFR